MIYGLRVKYDNKDLPSEYEECRMFWRWVLLQKPIVKDYMFKICNEGRRDPWYGNSLRAIGLRAGIPDYNYPLPNKQWNGLWIEMKRRDGVNKKKSPGQLEWLERLMGVKQYAIFTYGWEEAAKVTDDYINDRI